MAGTRTHTHLQSHIQLLNEAHPLVLRVILTYCHSHTAAGVIVLEDGRNYVQGIIHKILHLLAHCISRRTP